jgi:hypothetical protein
MSVTAPQDQEPEPATASHPDLTSLAADIHTDISAMANGLARQGAPPTVIQRLTQAAGMFQELHQVLSSEQPIPNPAHNPQGQAQQQQAQQGPTPTAGPTNQVDPHAKLATAIGSIAQGMAAMKSQGPQQ